MIARPIYAVLEREVLRMLRQKTRLVSAMVRPLIWLFVIGTGFGTVIGESRGMPYQSFLIPGVIGMTMLFFEGHDIMTKPNRMWLMIWIPLGIIMGAMHEQSHAFASGNDPGTGSLPGEDIRNSNCSLMQ